MPANLPPEYHKIEAELRTARTPQEKIGIYERLIAVIPHHKGTDKLIAMYRQKMAKAREEGERRQATAKHAPTYKVEKSGAGQVVLVGPPNAGKSSLVKALTGAGPEVADYPFTTRLPAPYMMPFGNVKVQLIDTPPVTGELLETWFPEMVKMADAVLLVADLADPDAAGVIEGILRRLEERKVKLVRPEADVPPQRFPFTKRTVLAANKIDAEGAPKAFEGLGVLLERPFERMAV
jgi:ribosome-interacting GTPase 1